MDNSSDAWAHLRDLAEDLADDLTVTKSIRDECSRIYNGINDGDITALNARDAQALSEALNQSIRDTKTRSF